MPRTYNDDTEFRRSDTGANNVVWLLMAFAIAIVALFFIFSPTFFDRTGTTAPTTTIPSTPTPAPTPSPR